MKRLVSSMRIAFRALEVNKLRSALTMLGIVIGVAAVIATAAIGSGAKQRIQQQIASIGSNVIIVLPGSLTSSGMRMGTGNAVTLSESDARELPAQCPDVALAVPLVRGGAQIVYENNNWATIVYGTTPGYLDVRDLSVAEGSAVYSARCGFGQQGRAARQDRGDQSFRRHRSRWPVDSHQEGAIHRGRRPRAQGAIAHRTRSGRRHPASYLHCKTQGPWHQVGQCRCRRVRLLMEAKSGEPDPGGAGRSQSLLRQRHHLQPGRR